MTKRWNSVLAGLHVELTQPFALLHANKAGEMRCAFCKISSLINGDGVGEILLELHFPEGALVEKAVNVRIANHFDNKGAQGVRVIDSDTGKVIYKQTWWDERRRRESAANELLKRI